MAATAPSSGMMPFIVSLNSAKPDASTRKLIRSHARRNGKRHGSRATCSRQAVSGVVQSISLSSAVGLYTPQVPSRVGGDLSFAGILGDIEDSVLLNIFKVQPIAREIIFPLRTAMGHDAAGKTGIYPIHRDQAALHITAYAIEMLIDTILRGQTTANPRAMLHLQRGFVLLRDRLSGDDADAKTSNATIAVVLKLASISHTDGDYLSARRHMEGVRRMVDLRGGVDCFRGQDLLAEIQRYDLAMALLNAKKPIFYTGPTEAPPHYPECLLHIDPDGLHVSGGPKDEGLVQCWAALRRFCLLVDLAKQTRRPMRPEIIHETAAAVMYRLIRLSFTPGSTDEAIRCGLLVLCHHVFLQWRDMKPTQSLFSQSYRAMILEFGSSWSVKPRLSLWLLMVGAVAMFDETDDAWLREHLELYAQGCRVTRWSEMHAVLRSMVWVDLLDEGPARDIFKRLLSQKHRPSGHASLHMEALTQ